MARVSTVRDILRTTVQCRMNVIPRFHPKFTDLVADDAFAQAAPLIDGLPNEETIDVLVWSIHAAEMRYAYIAQRAGL